MAANRKERRRLAREKRKRVARKETAESRGPFVTEGPFNGIPGDFIRASLAKIAADAVAKLPSLQEEAVDALKKCDPTYFLSNMVQYSLMVGVDDEGNVLTTREKNRGSLQQFHLEFAQAVFLTIPPRELSFLHAHPNDIQLSIDRLIELFECFRDARFVNLERAASDDERRLVALQEKIRLHTLGVRNWGHYDQVKSILRALYAPISENCELACGLSAIEIIEIFDRMLGTIEERSIQLREKLRAVLAKHSKKDLVSEYCQQFSIAKDEEEKILQMVKANRWSRRQLFALIISHSGLFITRIYEFPLALVGDWIKKPPDLVKKALSLLSFPFGGLEGQPLERIFLANPIWERPLIEQPDGSYFCALPQEFFAHSFHILDRLYSFDESSKRLQSRRRSEFLEDAIVDCFKSRFAAGVIERNVRWTNDNTQYETDLLVKIDTQLFIVEAKSHRISWPALRGAPERMKREIESIIASPARQSKRLEDCIRNAQNGVQSDFTLESSIALSDVHEITRLSVSLEDFSTIQSNLGELKEAGVLPADFPNAVTMSLADLQVVFSILDNPVDLIHYLQRRKTIQERWQYLADELDILGLYLDTGLDFGDVEEGSKRIIAIGMSKKIDDYFQSAAMGVNCKKPARQMSRWFADVRDRLAERRMPGWTEAALILLDLCLEDQRRFEAHFETVRAKLAKRRPATQGTENTTIGCPPSWRKTGLAMVAFYEDETAARHNMMSNAAANVFDGSEAERCLVFARDVQGKAYPYASLAVFDRSKDEKMAAES